MRSDLVVANVILPAVGGIFMPDARPAANLPISGLWNRLRMHWLAYLEAKLHGTGKEGQ